MSVNDNVRRERQAKADYPLVYHPFRLVCPITHLSIIRLDWCVQLSTCLWVCVPTLPIHSSTHMSIICLSSSDLVPPPPTPSHHTPIHHHPRTHPSNVTQQQVSPLLLPPIRLSLGSFPSVHSSSVLPPSHTNCSVEVIQGTGALPRL